VLLLVRHVGLDGPLALHSVVTNGWCREVHLGRQLAAGLPKLDALACVGLASRLGLMAEPPVEEGVKVVADLD